MRKIHKQDILAISKAKEFTDEFSIEKSLELIESMIYISSVFGTIKDVVFYRKVLEKVKQNTKINQQ